MRNRLRNAALTLCSCAFITALFAPASAQKIDLAARSANESSAISASAGAAHTIRRIASLKSALSSEGSRVTVTSDSSLEDYGAFREGARYVVVIPRAHLNAPAGASLEGRGFRNAKVERAGDDLRLTFELEPGAKATVRQSFNRLEIFFAAQEDGAAQKQSGQSSDGNGQVAAPSPSPTRQLTSSPADGAPATTNTTTPSTNPAASSVSTETPTSATKPANSRDVVISPEKRAPVPIKMFDKAPVIDGKLDEEVWKTAAVFKDFIQFRPVDLVPPSKQTEAYIGYDAKFLYIAFRAFDEPEKVRATIAKRDSIFDDDWVGVFLDTFNDGRRAYELLFNPLGVQADATFVEGVNEDFSVDVVMESKGSITSEGYVVEVAIPFKSLRYTAGKDKLWGIHLIRTIKRFNNEQSSWMPVSKDNSSVLNQRGFITGLEGLSTERTLELIPSLTISQEGRRTRSVNPNDAHLLPGGVDQGRFLNKPIEFDPGLTAKFTITPQITLDAAINPDFAQVEADATVVTANQRFPIFFEEKRPFFLEGKEIFETLISAVHTRTIVDPDYALKLTGKQGRNSFGVLFASDNAPGNLSDDQKDFILDKRNDLRARESLAKLLDKNANVGILRFKRDVGKEHHIGFLATTRNFVDQHNHIFSFDSRFRLNKTTTLTGQLIGSVTRRPFFYPDEAGVFDRKEKGMAYSVILNMDGRNWGYETGSTGRSLRFRADLGFNRRFDTNNPFIFVRYKTDEKPKNWLISWRIFNALNSNFDWKARLQRYNNETQLQLRLQNQTFVGLGVEKGYERVFEHEFGPSREGFRNIVDRTFSPEIARGLPACDQFGTLPAPDPANPRLRVPLCTFYGADNERSASRKTVYAYLETTPSKKYSFFIVNVNSWGSLDLDFGTSNPRYPRVSPAALALGQDAPLDPGEGNEWVVESNGSYQPTDALRMSLSYTKVRLTRNDTGLAAFDDNIFSLRGTYQFTRFWFARARADYTTLNSRMRMQYLLGWTPNPGTSLFVGYNDDLNRSGLNPFTGDLEPGFRRNGRLFFIKMSYLFRRSF